MLQSKQYHFKPLLTSITNGIEVLWAAHRCGALAPNMGLSSSPAAQQVLGTGTAASASAAGQRHYLVECILKRISPVLESCKHQVFGYTGDTREIDKEAAAIKVSISVISKFLGSTQPLLWQEYRRLHMREQTSCISLPQAEKEAALA